MVHAGNKNVLNWALDLIDYSDTWKLKKSHNKFTIRRRKMKEYRILVELDRNRCEVFSYAVLETGDMVIEEWFGCFEDALEYVDKNGKLATDLN